MTLNVSPPTCAEEGANSTSPVCLTLVKYPVSPLLLSLCRWPLVCKCSLSLEVASWMLSLCCVRVLVTRFNLIAQVVRHAPCRAFFMCSAKSDVSWDCSEASLAVRDADATTRGDVQVEGPLLEARAFGDSEAATIIEYQSRLQSSVFRPGDVHDAGWWVRPLLAAVQPEMGWPSCDGAFDRPLRVGTLCSGTDSPLLSLKALHRACRIKQVPPPPKNLQHLLFLSFYRSVTLFLLSLKPSQSRFSNDLQACGVPVTSIFSADPKAHAAQFCRDNCPSGRHFRDIDECTECFVREGFDVQAEIDVLVAGPPCAPYSRQRSNKRAAGAGWAGAMCCTSGSRTTCPKFCPKTKILLLLTTPLLTQRSWSQDSTDVFLVQVDGASWHRGVALAACFRSSILAIHSCD